MKVAVVYDRVNKFGGAERFLQEILKIFPKAPLYTLVHEPQTSKWAKKHKVISTFLNKISFFRSRHEILAPIASLAFETLDFKSFDLIISVTSSDAKAVITHPNQTHICICLTPTRYFWSEKKHYSNDLKFKILPRFIFNYLRLSDKLLSNRPDFYIAISREVQKRLQKNYQRESTIIYPPVNSKFFVKSPQSKVRRRYYLVVSRLVPYKKIDLVIKVFSSLRQKLVIVGVGSELKKLKKNASKNIVFAGKVDDNQLKKLYKDAKAVIFPQKEDFGLVPLEAQASGTPVIAYKKGGALETVVDGKTGIFFSKQSPKSLKLAIAKFEKITFRYQNCIKNAKKFRQDKFRLELVNYIKQVS